MKTIILFLILIFNQHSLFSQKQKMTKYKYYIETRSYETDWVRKFYLKNGLVEKFQDIHNKQGLTNEFIYSYDKNDNITKQVYTSYIGAENESKFKIKNQLTYNGEYLIKKKDNFNWITHYSDFNELGKPKLIKVSGKNKDFYSIERIIYDARNNISSSKKETFYKDTLKSNEVEILEYKYDEFNNITELKRSYTPKKELPIIMIGGINKYEKETYKYEYNKDNLWTKKTMFINSDGQEKIITYWTREYK